MQIQMVLWLFYCYCDKYESTGNKLIIIFQFDKYLTKEIRKWLNWYYWEISERINKKRKKKFHRKLLIDVIIFLDSLFYHDTLFGNWTSWITQKIAPSKINDTCTIYTLTQGVYKRLMTENWKFRPLIIKIHTSILTFK